MTAIAQRNLSRMATSSTHHLQSCCCRFGVEGCGGGTRRWKDVVAVRGGGSSGSNGTASLRRSIGVSRRSYSAAAAATQPQPQFTQPALPDSDPAVTLWPPLLLTVAYRQPSAALGLWVIRALGDSLFRYARALPPRRDYVQSRVRSRAPAFKTATCLPSIASTVWPSCWLVVVTQGGGAQLS